MYTFSWENITSEKRIPNAKRSNSNFRSEIESDYLRIVKSASFRRLQDKTQVFPLDQSDFVRTRLTHSYEVSSIAKLIGKQICSGIASEKLEEEENCPNTLNVIEILNCAGLLHDIGNPPFGHFGETAIRQWFVKNLKELKFRDKPLIQHLTLQQQKDLENFEGNAQALRIVSKLHRLSGTNGMHLTSAVMDCIIKYPCNSLIMCENQAKEKSERNLLHKKIGYYASEEALYKEIKKNTGTMDCRNPLTFILEAADDIAYTFADLEDGYNKHLYTYEELLQAVHSANDEVGEKLLVTLLEDGNALVPLREKGFQAKQYAVFTWLTRKQLYCISAIRDAFLQNYEDIMNGECRQELIELSKEKNLLQNLKSLAYHNVYQASSILKLELMGNEIISFLLDRFAQALLHYDCEEDQNEVDDKYIALLSGNYLDNYTRTASTLDSEGDKLYHRLLLAADYIAGMSDGYAKTLYRELKGM